MFTSLVSLTISLYTPLAVYCEIYPLRQADMENVYSFLRADFFNPKFYPEARKLRQNFKCIKTVQNRIPPFFLVASLPSFLIGIKK